MALLLNSNQGFHGLHYLRDFDVLLSSMQKCRKQRALSWINKAASAWQQELLEPTWNTINDAQNFSNKLIIWFWIMGHIFQALARHYIEPHYHPQRFQAAENVPLMPIQIASNDTRLQVRQPRGVSPLHLDKSLSTTVKPRLYLVIWWLCTWSQGISPWEGPRDTCCRKESPFNNTAILEEVDGSWTEGFRFASGLFSFWKFLCHMADKWSIQENDSLNGFIQKLRSMPIPKAKKGWIALISNPCS